MSDLWEFLLRTFINRLDALWMVSEPLVFCAFGFLLAGSHFARFSQRGWHYTDRCYAHAEMEPVREMVTPRRVYGFVVDSGGISDIFLREADIDQPHEMYSESSL